MSRDEWAAQLRRLNPDMDAENFERSGWSIPWRHRPVSCPSRTCNH